MAAVNPPDTYYCLLKIFDIAWRSASSFEMVGKAFPALSHKQFF